MMQREQIDQVDRGVFSASSLEHESILEIPRSISKSLPKANPKTF
jgi:hypothetical protein